MTRMRRMDKRTAAAPLIIAVAAGLAIAGSPDSAAQPDAPTPNASGDFLTVVAAQTGLPAPRWTASGIHTAKGYTTAAAEQTNRASRRRRTVSTGIAPPLLAAFASLCASYTAPVLPSQKHHTFFAPMPGLFCVIMIHLL